MFAHTLKNVWIAVTLVGLLGAASAHAGDGVIEINMAAANAGGITAGDAPGLPVTLSEEGSYRLTGNLSTGNANTHVIEVTESFVTIDLNGFVISGPGIAGSGNGVYASSLIRNVTVKNGMVRDMGSGGIRLAGASSTVEHVNVRLNEDNGIQLGSYGTVRNCTAWYNGDTGISISTGGRVMASSSIQNGFNNASASGIFVSNGGSAIDNVSQRNAGEGIVSGRGATILGNAAYENGEDGIRAGEGSLLKNNTARDNDLFGLRLGANSGYGGNVLTGNTSGSVLGGTQIDTNFCGVNTVCP